MMQKSSSKTKFLEIILFPSLIIILPAKDNGRSNHGLYKGPPYTSVFKRENLSLITPLGFTLNDGQSE